MDPMIHKTQFRHFEFVHQAICLFAFDLFQSTNRVCQTSMTEYFKHALLGFSPMLAYLFEHCTKTNVNLFLLFKSIRGFSTFKLWPQNL